MKSLGKRAMEQMEETVDVSPVTVCHWFMNNVWTRCYSAMEFFLKVECHEI